MRTAWRHALPSGFSYAVATLPSSDAETETEAYAAGISCVPYAREVSGVEIRGNARTWWNSAAGVYARGFRPEPGAVLSFRSSGGMSLGHVAVVERQVSQRELMIDHANWGGPGIHRGTIMQHVSVVDVSDNNDWTAVRVQLGTSHGDYGRVYPTNGFIYNRPDNGMMQANSSSTRGAGFVTAAAQAAEPLMHRRTQYRTRLQEVAEAPPLLLRNVSFGIDQRLNSRR